MLFPSSTFGYKELLRIGFFIAIVILLGYFLYQMDLFLVYASLQEIGMKFLLVILVSGIAYGFAALAWSNCLPENNIGFWKIFQVRHIGEMLSILNPTSIIAGDGLKYFLLKKEPIDNSDLAGSILISRFLIAISFVLLSLLTIGFYSLKNYDGLILYVIGTSMVLVLLCAFYVVKYLRSSRFSLINTYRLFKNSRLRFLYKKSWEESIEKLSTSCTSFIRKDPRSFYRAFSFSLIHWIIGALEFWLILKLLHVDILITDALFLECGVIACKSALSFVPGQFGVEELANKVLLGAITIVNPVIWLSLSVIKRLRQLVWICIAVLFYYLIENKPKQHESIVSLS